MTAESDVETAVCDYAIERGFIVRKLKWADMRGAPDRYFTHLNGVPRSFMIEFKAPGESVRPDQFREIRRLIEHGTRVHICDNELDGKQIIDAALTHLF